MIEVVEEYRIATGQSCAELENSVRHYLKCGWQLIGGLAISHDFDTGRDTYAQAITKKDYSEG